MQSKHAWHAPTARAGKRSQGLAKSERALRCAKIETGAGLSDNLKARVRVDLERIYGPRLTTSFVESPALIDGMRITVGSDLYDGSVRGTLAALERVSRLINKVPQLERKSI